MPHFFISYRRSDQEGRYLAHMIFRELRGLYGEQSVFLDVDSLSPGLSFPRKVAGALDRTDVVLVIIGPAWMRLLEERLADSNDWVRYEVAQSLQRTWLPVVPVLCTGVEMPRVHQLPDDLKELGWRDGITLDPFQDFDSHLHRFLINIERVLEELREEKERLRALRVQLVTAIAGRRERALRSLLSSLTSRLRRLEREERARRIQDEKRFRAHHPRPAAAVRYPLGASGDSRKFEPIIRLAEQYNRRVARSELWIGVMAVFVGILAGFATGSIWLAFAAFLGSCVFPGAPLWSSVVDTGSEKLKRAIASLDLTAAQRAGLAHELNAVNWDRRAREAVTPIISDLESRRAEA